MPDLGTWEFVSGQCHRHRRCTEPNGSATTYSLGGNTEKALRCLETRQWEGGLCLLLVVMQLCMPKVHMALSEIICICLMSKNLKSRVLRLVVANRLLFTSPKEIK